MDNKKDILYGRIKRNYHRGFLIIRSCRHINDYKKESIEKFNSEESLKRIIHDIIKGCQVILLPVFIERI